jgi:hypothetical protein
MTDGYILILKERGMDIKSVRHFIKAGFSWEPASPPSSAICYNRRISWMPDD